MEPFASQIDARVGKYKRPYFQVEYARLMILGQLVTGSEEEFLSIYERHVRNDPTGWLKLVTRAKSGREISYRRFSEEIIDLYKTAMDSGLHAAMRSMACSIWCHCGGDS